MSGNSTKALADIEPNGAASDDNGASTAGGPISDAIRVALSSVVLRQEQVAFGFDVTR